METIIGLGAAGCRIADEFKKYEQYTVYKIDTDIEGKNCFNFKKQNSPEEYELHCPDMKLFFKNIEGDILFILSGAGKISGASLKILEYFKNKNINVLYIKSNKEDLTTLGSLQEKLTFNVLQEYARSGLLQKIFLVSNENIEQIIGDVAILQHTKKINEVIVNAIHYYNIFSNTEPALDNYEKPDEIARIATFGIYSFKEEEEKYFFNISLERNKIYFFGIPESILDTDTKLLKTIRDIINKNNIKASYKVFSTKHKDSFCYFLSFSNAIQALDN